MANSKIDRLLDKHKEIAGVINDSDFLANRIMIFHEKYNRIDTDYLKELDETYEKLLKEGYIREDIRWKGIHDERLSLRLLHTRLLAETSADRMNGDTLMKKDADLIALRKQIRTVEEANQKGIAYMLVDDFANSLHIVENEIMQGDISVREAKLMMIKAACDTLYSTELDFINAILAYKPGYSGYKTKKEEINALLDSKREDIIDDVIDDVLSSLESSARELMSFVGMVVDDSIAILHDDIQDVIDLAEEHSHVLRDAVHDEANMEMDDR